MSIINLSTFSLTPLTPILSFLQFQVFTHVGPWEVQTIPLTLPKKVLIRDMVKGIISPWYSDGATMVLHLYRSLLVLFGIIFELLPFSILRVLLLGFSFLSIRP